MIWILLYACAEPEKTEEASCDPGGIDAGEAAATIDGESWEGGGATWLFGGSSLQLNTSRTSGWFYAIVAQHTGDGTTLEDALAGASFPIDVALVTGEEGGWGTLYPEEGASYTTKEAAGGTLVLSGQDGDHLLGCFAFEAAGDDGTVTVSDGRFDALPSSE